MVEPDFGSIRGVYLVVFLGAAVTCFGAVVGSRSIDHPDVRRGVRSPLVLSTDHPPMRTNSAISLRPTSAWSIEREPTTAQQQVTAAPSDSPEDTPPLDPARAATTAYD